MTRVALYARYSSDSQRDASIEDQLRLCREQAAREGWSVAGSYEDAATLVPRSQVMSDPAGSRSTGFFIATL